MSDTAVLHPRNVTSIGIKAAKPAIDSLANGLLNGSYSSVEDLVRETRQIAEEHYLTMQEVYILAEQAVSEHPRGEHPAAQSRLHDSEAYRALVQFSTKARKELEG